MLVDDNEKAINYFNTLNFVDSDVHGFQVDGFKVSVLIGVFESNILGDLGLNETYEELIFHFLYPSQTRIGFERPHFAYSLVDGELGHCDIASFQNSPRIVQAGRHDGKRNQYRVSIEIDGGVLDFTFVELKIDRLAVESLAVAGFADYAPHTTN